MTPGEIKKALEVVFTRVKFLEGGLIRAERVVGFCVSDLAGTAEHVKRRIPKAGIIRTGEARESNGRTCFWVEFRIIERRKVLPGAGK